MSKNMLNFRYILPLLFGVALSALGGMSSVQAADEIDVNWEDEPLFEVDAIAPGDKTTKNARVQNDHATESADLYFKIFLNSDKELAEQLRFYLIDKSSGKYLIGGPGDRFNLKKLAEEGNVFVERLDPGESNRYKVKVKFDKDAGNEFQGRKTEFDIKFKLVSETAEPGSSIPLRAGVPAGGTEGAEEDGTVEGAETETDEPITTESDNSDKNTPTGITAGVKDACSSWPLWAWILLLVAFTAIFNIKKLTQNEALYKNARFIQIAALIISLIIWYLFDVCREYIWVAITLIIIAIISSIILKRDTQPQKPIAS